MTWRGRIVAFSLARRYAVLDTGELVPITHFLDADGNETLLYDRCATFIAGHAEPKMLAHVEGDYEIGRVG